MNKINLGKIYNDFGDTLPVSGDEFFNNRENEVTREMVQSRYSINSNYRSYEALKKEYNEYVANLKKIATSKKKETKE